METPEKPEDSTSPSGEEKVLQVKASSSLGPVCRLKVLVQKLLVAPRSPRQKFGRPHRSTSDAALLLSASFEKAFMRLHIRRLFDLASLCAPMAGTHTNCGGKPQLLRPPIDRGNSTFAAKARSSLQPPQLLDLHFSRSDLDENTTFDGKGGNSSPLIPGDLLLTL